jgi:hypothetical protein
MSDRIHLRGRGAHVLGSESALLSLPLELLDEEQTRALSAIHDRLDR